MNKHKLEMILSYSVFVIALTLLKLQSNLLENVIEGKSFAIQFMSLSIMPAGYWYFKRGKAYEDSEAKIKLLFAQCFSILFLGLFAAAILNTQTAKKDTEIVRVYVSKHGGTKGYRKNEYVHLVIEGKDERFNPDPKSYKSFNEGDSIDILIGHGILGYDCILEFNINP